MNHQFDELAKGLARSVTPRQALKRFGVGLAGVALQTRRSYYRGGHHRRTW